MQAIYDPDRLTSGPSSLLRRVFVYGGSAAIHLGLAAMAINLALAARATDEDRQVRDWTAWVLGQPFGRLLIMMLGVGIALGGIALGAKAIAGDFRSKLPWREPETGWIVMLGQAGFAARGFVFVLVARSCRWSYDPQQAVGVAGVGQLPTDAEPGDSRPLATLLGNPPAFGELGSHSRSTRLLGWERQWQSKELPLLPMLSKMRSANSPTSQWRARRPAFAGW